IAVPWRGDDIGAGRLQRMREDGVAFRKRRILKAGGDGDFHDADEQGFAIKRASFRLALSRARTMTSRRSARGASRDRGGLLAPDHSRANRAGGSARGATRLARPLYASHGGERRQRRSLNR